MAKKQEQKTQLTDYKLAKDTVNKLDLLSTVILTVGVITNFRKYIREVANGKLFSTTVINSELKQISVTRLK